MKSIYLVLFMVLMFTSCKKEDSSESNFDIPAQLLMNADVETPAGDLFSWISYGSGINTGFNAILTDEEAFSPSHSLKIARTTVDTNYFWVWYQSISNLYFIPYGQDLTLTAKIKGVNLEGWGVAIALRCDGKEQDYQFETTQETTPITGNFDWTTYTIDLLDVKSTITSINVFLIYLPSTTGTVYFDDITLTHK